MTLIWNNPRSLICHKKFLRQSLLIFIIKGFRNVVFIFSVISTTFRPIYPPGFFRCLSKSGTYTELRTTSFIGSTGVTCSDSVTYNRVQVLSIPILWRCPWCNGYRRRKWIQRHEFKSWTRLIAFHIALIPLGKVWIQLFSLQLWVNSSLNEATSLGEGKLWIETC